MKIVRYTLLGARLSVNHISPEGQMSLLGLPIPVPGLYAKNNLNDGLCHRAASTVCDREPDRIITGTDWWTQRWMYRQTELACSSYRKFQHYVSGRMIMDSLRSYKARLRL